MDHRLDWELEREEREERETLEAIKKHRELVEEWLKSNGLDSYILGKGAVYLMRSYHACVSNDSDLLLFESKIGDLKEDAAINPVEGIAVEKEESLFKIGLENRVITVDKEANITRIE